MIPAIPSLLLSGDNETKPPVIETAPTTAPIADAVAVPATPATATTMAKPEYAVADYSGGVQERYDDLATQQASSDTVGLDVAGMNTAVDEASNIKEGSEYVSPESLVENRLESMLGDKDNKMNKRLMALGTMGANRAGLASTSMGAGAAIGSTAATLQKVASQDADTIKAFNQGQQAAEYKIEDYKSQAAVSAELNKQEAQQRNFDMAFDTARAGLDKATSAEFEVLKTKIDNEFQSISQQFDADLQTSLQNQQITAAEAADIRKTGAEMIQNHQITMGDLLGNTTFLGLGPTAVGSIMNNLTKGASASLAYNLRTAGAWNTTQRNYVNDLNSAFTFTSTFTAPVQD